MFIKNTTFKILENGIEVIDTDLMKVASADILPKGVGYDPEFLYIYVKAVSAGEYYGDNKNNDFFPEEELKAWYKTFLTAHTFKNHENKDIKNAIGDVVFAEWDEEMKCVKLLIRVDRRIAPSIVRGYEKGYMTDVSMGCRVSHVVCPICGIKAKTKKDYCHHLLYQKGQILPDGRKVYEINIAPKFHDISTVLNGAEKTAKAEKVGLSLNNGKVLLTEGREKESKTTSFGMEKAASFEGLKKSFVPDFYEPELDIPLSKKASDSNLYKLAEIKKDIQMKIEKMVKGEIVSKETSLPDEICDTIKLFGEEYMDKETTLEISDKIRNIAKKNMTSPIKVFRSFLEIMAYAGVILTPLEFAEILSSIVGKDIPDIRQLSIFKGSIPPSQIGDASINSVGGRDVDLGTALERLSLIMKDPAILDNRNIFPSSQPKVVRIFIAGKPGAESSCNNYMSDILPDFENIIKERSILRESLAPRLIKIASGDMDKDNKAHFDIFSVRESSELMKHASLSPFALAMQGYCIYQNDIAQKLASEDFFENMTKVASYTVGSLEKTAAKKPKELWGSGKAILYGIPAVYGYSALQRARINKGDDVNTLNRYVAENPGYVSILQAALAPSIGRNLSKITSTKGKGIAGKLDNILLDKFSSFGDNEFMEKISATTDIFEDNYVDDALSKKYNKNQISAIKEAALDTASGREDLAQQKLAGSGLHEDSLIDFLKVAHELVKMNIEDTISKTAELGEIKNLGLSVAGDILFNPMGASSMALLPGNVLDGLIFNKIQKSLTNKKKPVSDNNLKGE